MSERTAKRNRRENYEIVNDTRPGHPRGLCGAGFHDFGKVQKRSARWETVKEPDGKERQVYKKGLRARACRNCSHGEQVHTREGYWINSRGLKL